MDVDGGEQVIELHARSPEHLRLIFHAVLRERLGHVQRFELHHVVLQDGLPLVARRVLVVFRVPVEDLVDRLLRGHLHTYERTHHTQARTLSNNGIHLLLAFTVRKITYFRSRRFKLNADLHDVDVIEKDVFNADELRALAEVADDKLLVEPPGFIIHVEVGAWKRGRNVCKSTLPVTHTETQDQPSRSCYGNTTAIDTLNPKTLN